MKKIFLLGLAGMLAACSTENDEAVSPVNQNNAKRQFTVSFDETRVALGFDENDNPYTAWNAGDEVAVYLGTNKKAIYTFKGEDGERTGILEETKSADEDTVEEKTFNTIVALYFHETNHGCNAYNGKFSNIPIQTDGKQNYVANGYDPKENIMYAVADLDATSLNFKNAMGYLKLNLTGTISVKEIKIESNNNSERLFGFGYFSSESDGSVKFSGITNGGSNDGYYMVLNCGEGVALDKEESTPFYIVLPPVTLSQGFTVTITDTEGNTYEKKTEKEVTIERNVILPMKAFDVAGEQEEPKYTIEGEPKVGAKFSAAGVDGVVIAYDDEGHGYAITIQKITNVAWSTETVATGATDENDGMKNLEVIKQIEGWESKYPAFAACAALGEGWYLPADNEIRNIYSNMGVITTAMNIEKSDFSNCWTSTEESAGTTHIFGGDAITPGVSKTTQGFSAYAIYAF